jgi:hypothetical protein
MRWLHLTFGGRKMSIARGVPFVRVASSMLVSVWGAVLLSLGGCVTPSSGDDDTGAPGFDTGASTDAATDGTPLTRCESDDDCLRRQICIQGVCIDKSSLPGQTTGGVDAGDDGDDGAGDDGVSVTDGDDAGGTTTSGATGGTTDSATDGTGSDATGPADSDADTDAGTGTDGPLEAGCVLSVTPQPLDFGNVVLRNGSFSEKPLQFVNSGDTECLVASWGTFTPSSFTAVGDLPVSFPAGATTTVTVRFEPPALGAITGQLNLGLVAGRTKQFAIRFVAAAIEPGICNLTITPAQRGTGTNAAPSYVDFKAVAVGGSKTAAVKFEHAANSTDACEISTGVFGAATDKAFAWASPPSFPVQIPPGSSYEFKLKYSPTSKGIAGSQGNPFCGVVGGSQVCGDNWVKFTSNAANEPTIPASSGGGGTPCIFPGFPPGCSEGTSTGTATGKGWFVTLKGEGVTESFSCLPSAVTFPSPTVGCASPEETVTCYNKGQTEIEVTSWSTDKPTRFEIVGTSPAPASPGASIKLTPGSSMTIRLRYKPSAATTDTGKLTVASPAAANQAGALDIPLSGEGKATAAATETFTLPTKPQVDMLWAIDNSGSMSEEQFGLATNVPTFTSAAASANADFHIGVVTSEINDPYTADTGACRGEVGPGWLYYCPGTPKWVEPTTPNLASVLGNNLRPGTCCSDSQEAPLEAARLALSEPNISDPAINGGFYRDDAVLALVFMTDEIEQSDGSTDYYADFFKSLKGARTKDQLNVSIITGLNVSTKLPAACSSSNGEAEEGSRLYNFYTAIGNGKALSICDSNWGSTVVALANNLFTQQTSRSLPLARVPSESTITVKKGTTTVPKDTTSSGNGWTYDSELNAVVLGAKTTGLAGATITVTYNSVCF